MATGQRRPVQVSSGLFVLPHLLLSLVALAVAIWIARRVVHVMNRKEPAIRGYLPSSVPFVHQASTRAMVSDGRSSV